MLLDDLRNVLEHYISDRTHCSEYTTANLLIPKANFKSLDVHKEKVGLYMFREKESRELLYIGESSNENHSLRKRIPQHLSVNDTGATLLIKMFDSGDFISKQQALHFLRDNTIIEVFEFTLEKKEIQALELLAIALFKPKYN